MFVWGCPCLRTGVDHVIGLQAILGNSPPRRRSRRCTNCHWPDRCPGSGSLVELTRPGPICLAGLPHAWLLDRGDLATDRPNKACEFTGDGSDGHGLELSFAGEPAEAGAQPALRLPGDGADPGGRRRHFGLLVLADPGRVLIAPGALHEDAAGPPVAGFGDRTAPDRIAGRVFRRHQAEISHHLARALKA